MAMVNLINYMRLFLLIFLYCLAGISTLTLTHDSLQHRLNNETIKLNQSKSQLNNNKTEIINNLHKGNKKDKNDTNTSDLLIAATDYQHRKLYLPLAIKPRGFNLPKNREAQHKQNETPRSASQNYYNRYFPDLPPLGHAQPYYSLTEDPTFAAFLNPQTKQFQPREQPFSGHDASILGSGDFGILKGGTFYSGEEQSYINEDGSELYYADASNSHGVSSTEGFIQKYTYPEEQFAQFRDFADLGTSADSAFSQYVVVYAAKNSTNNHQNTKPKNIFEQLQEIDKEKALEQKKWRKNQTSPSITKLKLVKTKFMEKKRVQKQPLKITEDDPLIALS